jgi:hypothetical protein
MGKPHGQTRALKNYAVQPEEDRLASAKAQGQAQFDSIREMVEALQVAERDEDARAGCAVDEARDCIREDALSIEVRSGWYAPGSYANGPGRDAGPLQQKLEEYAILLCTGGPACRIVGTLDEHGEPESARLEVQDWFQPWIEFRPLVETREIVDARGMLGKIDSYDSEPILLAYARCFWFGE